MKVLHVINSLGFGGAEKLLIDSLPLYKAMKIDVSILILNGTSTTFSKYLEAQGMHIIRLKKYKSLYNPLYVFKIRIYLSLYDIVHVHLFPSIYFVALASLTINNKPSLVYTEHSTENRRRKIFIFKYLDRLIYRRYSEIIAISNGTKTNLIKHLGQKFKNITVINNGINLKAIKEETPYKFSDFNINSNSKIIIQISNFSPQKDQDTLIKAVSELPRNVCLLLVGEGRLKKSSMSLVKLLKIEDKVKFLGHRSDVPKLVKMADISVLSSHYEGFGLAIVEGMAAGNPCIASNVPGLSEIVKDCGLLFPPGDYVKLKNHLLKLIDDKNFNKEISEKCFLKAQEYDICTMVEKYIQVYKKI